MRVWVLVCEYKTKSTRDRITNVAGNVTAIVMNCAISRVTTNVRSTVKYSWNKGRQIVRCYVIYWVRAWLYKQCARDGCKNE